MFCKNCGASVDDGVKFCPACGTQIPQPGAASSFPSSPEQEAPPIFSQPEPEYAPNQPEAPVYAVPTYAAPVQPAGDPSDILTWGIAGLVCSFFIGFLGIIFSAISLSRAKTYINTYGELPSQGRTGRGLSIAGLVLGILHTIVLILFIIFWIVAVSAAISTATSYY